MIRRVKRILLVLWIGLLTGHGDSLPMLDSETLLMRATWYGNTPERRAMKSEAREEVQRRMPDIVRDIMDRIHLENIGLRVLAMELVQGQHEPEVADILLPYLDADQVLTRRHALFYLSLLEVPEAADRVRPLLSDPELQGGAVRALAAWGDIGSVPAMIPGLSSTNERIRVATANALRHLRSADAVAGLITALDDPVFTVRNAAARALITYGEGILPDLKRTVAEPVSERQQRQLLRVIAEVMGEPGGAWLMQTRDELTGSAHRDVEWLIHWVSPARIPTGVVHRVVVDRTLFGE